MEKKTAYLAIGVVAIIVVAGIAAALMMNNTKKTTDDFKESGSTTMAEIAALWASQFKKDTGITVSISTPGSGAGIKSYYSGEVQVAQASRAITAAERTSAAANNITVTEWKVAVDGIAIIVNSANPVKSLTLSQLEGIFNGTITNWKTVGGNDQQIVLYGRDSASGSYASFKDLVLKNGENYSSSMQQFNTNALIVPEVENNAGGVGYVGIGYAKEASGNIGILKLQKNSTSPAYSPVDQTAVYNGTYSLSRYLYLYTNGVPALDSGIYKWISFVLNETGQQLVQNAGFYELQSSDLAAMKAQLATAKSA
jgi:phosphate transport system substrate-binding protein